MSLLDQASLVLVPSAIKTGEVLVQKPLPNKFSDETGNYDGNDPQGSANLTFTRNSNATRVDADGLVEKVRTNSLLQSNSFDTTWLNAATTETGGQAGYDGSNDAWRIDKSNTGAYIIQTISVSGINTFSVYAKAGTLNWIRLNINFTSGTDPIVYFDLANGAIGSTPAGQIDAKIESVGNGWYRCSVAGNGTIQDVRFFPANADNDVSGTSGNIYIQDAQLEQGLVATSYIETTTTAMSEFAGVTASSVADVPRLDYSGGSCPSLLLEPQRTNLVENSEYLSASSWGATRCTISTNTSDTLSPEGVLNAAKMVSTNSSESYVQDNVTVTTSGVFSFFAKKGDLDYCHSLIWDLTANGRRQWFNLATGTVGSTTVFGSGYDKVDAGMEDYGNGWWRCWFAWNNGGASSGVRVNISSADSDINSPVDSYGYFYGCQVESGVSYPTSYIPTNGTAVTRLADSASRTNIANLIGQTEGTLFAEMAFARNKGTSSPFKIERISLSDGTDTNRVFIGNTTTANEIQAFVRNATGISFNETVSVADITSTNKIALKYKANDFALWINGVEVASSTSLSYIPANLSNFQFAGASSLTLYAYEGTANQVILFPTALTDAQLVELTTL